MGSSFQSIFLKDKYTISTAEELENRYAKIIKGLRLEYGTDPYSGTLATCSGLSITTREFSERDEADQYISDNTEKWGDALAVILSNETQKGWVVGGWCAE